MQEVLKVAAIPSYKHNNTMPGKKNPGICIPGKKTKNQLTFKPPGDFVPVDETPKRI